MGVTVMDQRLRLCLVAAQVAGLLLAGCSGVGPAGYTHGTLGYRVPRGDADGRFGQFLSPNWRPRRARNMDLYLDESTGNGVLWIQTIVLPEELEQAEMSVLLRRYTQSIAGGQWWARIDHEPTWIRWAPSVAQDASVALGGQPAHAALIDVSGTGAWQQGTQSRAAVLLVRIDAQSPRWVGEGFEGRPVLMIIGYANDLARFDVRLADYYRFVDSIEFPTAPSRPVLETTEAVDDEDVEGSNDATS